MIKSDLQKIKDEIADRTLRVRTSEDELGEWNKAAIVRSLTREVGVGKRVARDVADTVERQIKRMRLKTLTAPLIRELVNVELLRRGLESEHKKYQRLGVPLYDVGNIMLLRDEAMTSNNPHTPDTTNLTLAQEIKKDYALSEVYSPKVVEAHLKGDIHLHKLDFPDRPYCSGQSPEYVKKYGLIPPASFSLATPAKHPEVFILQLIRFAAMLQIHFSGAIGYEAVNMFFAPFLVGLSDRDIRQFAQMLIFEFNNQNVAKGSQPVFSDVNLYWEIPSHYEKTPAIGPGGKYTGKTYGDYEKESQRFLIALFQEYLKGDGAGRPFFWPKPNFHMTEKFWQTPGHEEFLELAAKVAAEKGNTEFFFDRGSSVRISQCCRLSFKLDKRDLAETKKPELMRHSATSWVTVNLPRIAYEANHSESKLFSLLKKRMDLIGQAHLQKRKFIKKILGLGNKGPLAALCVRQKGDPYPYYRFNRSVELTTIYALNEMVQHHTGKELHESDEALKFGLRVISFMNLYAKKQSKKLKIRVCLEQTPAEGISYRLAKLDMQWFPKQTSQVVKGNQKTGAVYYTNSSQLNVSKIMDPVERVTREGLFHPLIDAGAMTHIWIGEQKPSAKSIANFVKKTWENTQSQLIAFSPEFTLCGACKKTSRGLIKKCPFCKSADVDHMTRVSGFFSLTSRWNKGKIQELRERYKNKGALDDS